MDRGLCIDSVDTKVFPLRQCLDVPHATWSIAIPKIYKPKIRARVQLTSIYFGDKTDTFQFTQFNWNVAIFLRAQLEPNFVFSCDFIMLNNNI